MIYLFTKSELLVLNLMLIFREIYLKNTSICIHIQREGDILISASGSIGRTVEYTGEDAYYQDSNIVWLKHDKTIVNSFFKASL